jgi:hypothetical protein
MGCVNKQTTSNWERSQKQPHVHEGSFLMKISHHLINALVGLVSGILITIGFSYLWKAILPVVDRTGQGASQPIVLTIILILLVPITIAGGVIGGRIPREGGKNEALVYAALFGVLFALPFSCFLFWYTGW